MYSYSNRRKVSIELDADLIDWVDQLLNHSRQEGDSLQDDKARTEAIEAAVRSWCNQQTSKRLQQSADLHRQRHNNDETGWLV
jgi:metal-responsive CopG/Arc/MetJ family transcriptional regulator